MKNKILFILHLPPPVHGAAMVGKYIHDSHLLNSSFICKYINFTTADNLEDIGKLGLYKIKKIISLLHTIFKEIKYFKPNFVYITPNAKGGAFYKDFIVVLLLKMMGCKIIAHYHNKGVSLNENKRIDNFLYKIFFRNIKIILLADELYLDIKKYVTRENVYICPNGIPNTSMKNTNIEVCNTYPQILFLSNLLIDKGVYVLLDALQILKNKGLSFFCNFVGGETVEINFSMFLHEVEKRKLNKHVKYHGKKYGYEKDYILEQCDIFVLPTLNECFPLVLLEAMQHRTACIASSEGGIPNIINNEETGYVIEKNNPQILAEKIEFLITNHNLCKRMGDLGQLKYTEEYTLEKFESNMKQIFEDYVNKIRQK